MRYTEILWLISLLGIAAGFYGGSRATANDPLRPPITVSAVRARLKAVTEAKEATFIRVPIGTPMLKKAGLEQMVDEDAPDIHILRGEGLLIAYAVRGDKGHREEQVAVSLDETRGTIALLFHGATLRKVTIEGIEFKDDLIPRAIRADLGTILRLARLLIRDNA